MRNNKGKGNIVLEKQNKICKHFLVNFAPKPRRFFAESTQGIRVYIYIK